jgi:hypothetical protein
MTMQPLASLTLILTVINDRLSNVSAFGVPQPFLSHLASTAFFPSSLILSDGDIAASGLVDTVADAASATSAAAEAAVSTITAPETSSFMDSAGDLVLNFAVVVTVLLFLLAGLTALTGSIIIPAAAKELEKECMELAPEFWDEYQAKLEPGQTIAERPELMQELGAKLQPLLDAKIAAIGQRREGPISDTTVSTGSDAVDLSSLKDLAGLTTLMGSMVIPAVAKELEKECRELAPELWDKYQAKLEPGQTIAERPELMQELGATLKPLSDANMDAVAQRQQGSDAVDLSSLKDQWDGDDDPVIDAEILSSGDKASNDAASRDSPGK